MKKVSELCIELLNSRDGTTVSPVTEIEYMFI